MQADVAAIDIVLLFRSNQPILCYSLVSSQRLISYQLSSSHRSNKHPSLIIKHLLDHLIFKIALIAMSSLIQPFYEKTKLILGDFPTLFVWKGIHLNSIHSPPLFLLRPSRLICVKISVSVISELISSN